MVRESSLKYLDNAEFSRVTKIILLTGKIKRICETELGIVSQCCQPKQAAKFSIQYFENLALKINVKVLFCLIGDLIFMLAPFVIVLFQLFLRNVN